MRLISRIELAMALVGAGLLFYGLSEGRAHEAMPTAAQPLGWQYPYTCCSGFDCREVNGDASKVKIKETAEGYVILVAGKVHETIPYGDKKIKESPDGAFHWCSTGGKDDGKTICLFVPPRAF